MAFNGDWAKVEHRIQLICMKVSKIHNRATIRPRRNSGSYTHFYGLVPGPFRFVEIYRDAVADASHTGAKFVEIGVGYGRSTAYLTVLIANSGKSINIDVIDTWKLIGAKTQIVQTNCAFSSFVAYMHNGGVLNSIRPLHLDPVRAARLYEVGSVSIRSIQLLAPIWRPPIEFDAERCEQSEPSENGRTSQLGQ